MNATETSEAGGRAPTSRYTQRQSAIISSAVSVLNRKGVRGMTLGDVAASLNLVPTGVIYYFRNKEELAAACFLRGLEIFDRLVEQGCAAESSAGRLEGFITAYFDYQRRAALGEAEPITAFNDVRALDRPAVNDGYVAMFRGMRRLFDGPETAGLTRAEANARTHILLAETLWTAAWLPGSEPEDYPRAGQRLFRVLAHGLIAQGAVWPAAAAEPPPPPDAAEDPAELFLRAATELINEEGYIGASVEKISARLNLTKGAFYHHIPTKDDLVAACFERTFQVMRRTLRAAEAQSASGLEALVRLASTLVAHQLRGGAPLLRTSALTSVPEHLQPELLAKFNRMTARFASLISDGVADGSIRPVDVNIAAQALTAMINAAAELRHWTPDINADSAADRYVRPFFEGLLSPGGGRQVQAERATAP
jgi:AcrR family transcriptional regulator